MAFREGVLLYAQPGALPAPQLDQLIEAVRGVDMAEVHAQIAAQPQHGVPTPPVATTPATTTPALIHRRRRPAALSRGGPSSLPVTSGSGDRRPS